ncbi:MAG: hypothetical protein DRO36_03735 [Candidatus Hecatellales archaeon]|nr:MAG: hypothetical protein DRO36_03735 [Candidatus Hecatellales archaeon]
MVDEVLIKRLALDIVKARRVVALTGAGVSTESGIPDFRGPRGLWKKYDPKDFTYSAFLRNPRRYWELRLQRKRDGFVVLGAKPNSAHYALARLEKLRKLHCIITQNVDGLHQEAGSSRVIEFHGNSRWAVCIRCGERYPMVEVEERAERGELPPTCKSCGGVLKPEIVMFEEPIPMDALIVAREEAKNCDLMLVIGTSAVVYPAAELPKIAKMYGAEVVEINNEPTPLTGIVSDYMLEGRVGEILPKVVAEVEDLLRKEGKI